MDKTHFEVQEDVWKAMTPRDRTTLRALATQRLATHFGEARHLIEALVQYAFEGAAGEGEASEHNIVIYEERSFLDEN
jgi:hypothetical protein